MHPISVVEIEISPFSYEQHTRNGKGSFDLSDQTNHDDVLVITAAKELGVAVAGYS